MEEMGLRRTWLGRTESGGKCKLRALHKLGSVLRPLCTRRAEMVSQESMKR